MTQRLGVGELFARVRRDGLRGVSRRVVYELYRRTGAEIFERDIAEEDLVDSTSLALPGLTARLEPGATARVGWVATAPGPGSGGHTTLFRMIAGVASRGYPSTLFLYDPRGGDLGRHSAVIREHWPWLDVEIRDARAGITGVDAAVASSWETAHVLASYGTAPMARLYFIQDFEPFFHPRGSIFALAEDSYRFGFRNIALGHMVHDLLAEIGAPSELALFGRDADVYGLREAGPRSGVVFYVRRGNDRRGYLLGRLALEQFHRRHPEEEIHTFGDSVGDWGIPVTDHGHLPPARLNELYNRVVGGLALSFTNISLIAEEMLAAGAIPVVNDSRYARADLSHPDAVWAAPNAGALADALSRLVEAPDREGRAARAAAASSTEGIGWSNAQEAVARIIAEEVYGDAPETKAD